MTRLCSACSYANQYSSTTCAYCGEGLTGAVAETAVDHVHEQQAAEDAVGTAPPSFDGAPSVPSAGSGAAIESISLPSFQQNERDLEGIGGWLVLVAIGVVLSPFVLLFSMLRTYVPLLGNAHVWSYLETKPALQGLIFFELATNIISLLICLALLYLFFGRKKGFPIFMILYLGTHAIFLVADLILAHMLMPNTRVSDRIVSSVIRTVGGAAIWIPYMLVSRRVKLTFVR